MNHFYGLFWNSITNNIFCCLVLRTFLLFWSYKWFWRALIFHLVYFVYWGLFALSLTVAAEPLNHNRNRCSFMWTSFHLQNQNQFYKYVDTCQDFDSCSQYTSTQCREQIYRTIQILLNKDLKQTNISTLKHISIIYRQGLDNKLYRSDCYYGLHVQTYNKWIVSYCTYWSGLMWLYWKCIQSAKTCMWQ